MCPYWELKDSHNCKPPSQSFYSLVFAQESCSFNKPIYTLKKSVSSSKRQQAFTTSPMTAGAGDDLKDWSLMSCLSCSTASYNHSLHLRSISRLQLLPWSTRCSPGPLAPAFLTGFSSSVLSFLIPENVDDLRRVCKCLNLTVPARAAW